MNDKSRHPGMSLVDLILLKPRALTVREVATLLHLSERQIYKLAAAHRIPSFRICGSVRFDPVTTADWLQQSITLNSKEQAEFSGPILNDCERQPFQKNRTRPERGSNAQSKGEKTDGSRA
jgi:excisionase family DNA binding protein